MLNCLLTYLLTALMLAHFGLGCCWHHEHSCSDGYRCASDNCSTESCTKTCPSADPCHTHLDAHAFDDHAHATVISHKLVDLTCDCCLQRPPSKEHSHGTSRCHGSDCVFVCQTSINEAAQTSAESPAPLAILDLPARLPANIGVVAPAGAWHSPLTLRPCALRSHLVYRVLLI